jgi:hypothetical protein
MKAATEEEVDKIGIDCADVTNLGPSVATSALERRNGADATILGPSVALQRHMGKATPTRKQGRGRITSQHISGILKETSRCPYRAFGRHLTVQ